MTVVSRIFAHARRTPDKTALVHNGVAISYRRFAALIWRARVAFESRGLGAGRVAVLCIHSLIDGWIMGLALRSLGATTVAVRSVAEAVSLGVGPFTLVSTPTEVMAWPGLDAARAGAPLVMVGAEVFADWGSVDLESVQAAVAAPAGGAHILLTSGTTGASKKVLMDAAAEALDASSRAALFGFTVGTVADLFDFGGWTSVGHNVAVCLWTLGATVIWRQRPFRLTPGANLAVTTPYMLANLLEGAPEGADRSHGPTLFVGAGVLSLAQWRRASETLTGDVRTWVASTETGAFAATAIGSPEDLSWHRLHPGREVQVVDDRNQPLALGEVGLLRVRPLGVSGYLGDSETTSAFFRDGWFYPGDLAARRADGRLTLCGRVTEVINVQGDKIATLPIEIRLQESLDAEAVCVFSTPSEEGEAVHVAIQPRRPIAQDDLRRALLEALPGVAVSRVHAVRAFPRNDMGKIVRAALRRELLVKPPGEG